MKLIFIHIIVLSSNFFGFYKSYEETVRSTKMRYDHAYLVDSDQPVKITPRIQINKIYGINTLNETYIIDGYFVASWIDKRNIYKKHTYENSIYENQIADEKIGKEIWVPAFEFINVVGNRNIVNKQIIVEPDGKITYNERFNAVFTTVMNFKNFAFDRQCFSIQLEAFSYDNTALVFLEDTENITTLDDEMPEEWLVTEKKEYVNLKEYSHLSNDGSPTLFSRYNIEINAKRKIRHYLGQFIFPLFLIITISWSVFWMSNLSDQLATNFTLMLTVVAFNFHTSSILPNLPYSTFIESLITLGYFSIFISILIILIGHSRFSKNDKERYYRLMTYCKYIFPCGFLLINLLQAFVFFG